ncbi:hypothetical protein MOO45_01150 [Bombilactobacillus folatiphilus]|uniref:Integral membrane protein n=1 Tax=Bombilactobacillus folatiphilus TaxID=2923362 RepID=A0ABY4P9V7_9LACO|nr:hypothetical protein [Bombilactobacillus folatiphilus]UQS82329.1 hypothetical protein MOO45_01150 [Bombilactobacillus folatiphilus]
MKNLMIIIMILCLASVGLGILLESLWFGIIPLFVALVPTAYFAAQD